MQTYNATGAVEWAMRLFERPDATLTADELLARDAAWNLNRVSNGLSGCQVGNTREGHIARYTAQIVAYRARVDERSIPPGMVAALHIIRSRGHTVTVRRTRWGSPRYTVDGQRERNAQQLVQKFRGYGL